MFGWFKEKKPHENGGFKAISDRLLGPPALAVAIAETIASYEDAVRSGKAFFPAYKSKDASVIGIWSGLRLEALRSAFNFGASDPFNLSDTKQQMELLDSWLLEKPQFIFPQPSGGVLHDTLQGIFQVYLYLDKVGTEVCDRETDRATLKLKGVDIVHDFTSHAKILRDEWHVFEIALKDKSKSMPEIPKTLIELLYEDVTKKSKSVALSAKLGPQYESTIRMIEGQLKDDQAGLRKFKELTAKILAAASPDEFS